MRIKYDYIIIGSGIAGNVCAYELQKKGWSCLIIEKTQKRCEKVCGGGIPYKALERLQKIGMNLEELFSKDVMRIRGDIIYVNGKPEESIYGENNMAVGCRRAEFDDFLLREALRKGAEICWGMPVNNVITADGGYNVGYYYAHKVVIAAGARGLQNKYYLGQSIGISAQIAGESSFPLDRFTYFYLNGLGDRYFWIFPIGKNVWNVGLWFMTPDNSMRKTFIECWNKYIEPAFSSYIILQNPKAGFCGNISIEPRERFNCDTIGDYSGTNNIANGGGIYRAIKSALKYADLEPSNRL